MIHQTIQPFLPQVIELLKKHKIISAYVFGSVLTEKFNSNSDVDFLVTIQNNLDPLEMGEHLWNLTYELEELLKRNVDLLTERSLKNPYFIQRLNETKFPIYGFGS
jgi:predicted nucleotidyltransferase